MPCPTAQARHQALGLSRRRRGLTNATQRKATAVVKRSWSIVFGSCMANISFFYPDRMKGWALGLNAAGGNIGVSNVQLLIPMLIGNRGVGASQWAP